MADQTAVKQRPDKLLLTIDEAAQALSLGRTVLYELLAAGEIASIKIGGARRVLYASLLAFIERLLSEQVQR
jgi:excisionase family DNA binding protein